MRKPVKFKFGHSDRPDLLYEFKHIVLKLTCKERKIFIIKQVPQKTHQISDKYLLTYSIVQSPS